jgi:hypothetical protein
MFGRLGGDVVCTTIDKGEKRSFCVKAESGELDQRSQTGVCRAFGRLRWFGVDKLSSFRCN